jgi:putative ABC transport system permease protein
MHTGDAVHSALQSIASHKLRSLLTLTGIVIGVLAVVSMFSSVYALKALVKTNMEGMGWNRSIVIAAGAQEKVIGPRSMRRALQRVNKSVSVMDYGDFEALRDQVPHTTIYAMVENSVLTKHSGKDKYIRLRGTTNAFFTNKTYLIGKGRYFNAYENDNGMPAAVLGHNFALERFGTSNPVGKTLAIGSHRLKIVGVLKPDQLSSGNGMNFNAWERREDLNSVYLPLLYGTRYFGLGPGIQMIYLQAADDASFAEMKLKAREVLLARHRMYPNFTFMDVGAMLLTITNEIDSAMRKWNITLIAIASISLIVGGIGLFSTLLISIQERMAEIGVRKSIGATDADIFFYFIFEAVVLALIGAILGILLAWLVLRGISGAIHFPLYLPTQGVLVGLFFSAVVGIVSGIYPALKAAGIDPVKAIYYTD